MPPPVIGISRCVDRSASLSNLPIIAISQTCVRAVELSEGAPMVITPYLERTGLRALLDHMDGLLLSGRGNISPPPFGEEDSGLPWPVDERRDRGEVTLARRALKERLRLMGICRGVQALSVLAVGTHIQDIAIQVPNAPTHCPVAGKPIGSITHSIKVTRDSQVARLSGAGELGVNSGHHQAAKVVAANVVITARAGH